MGEFQCVVTLWFDKGQIPAQGLIEPSETFPDRFEVAITGGTGAYEGAGGHAKIVQQSENRARLIVSAVA